MAGQLRRPSGYSTGSPPLAVGAQSRIAIAALISIPHLAFYFADETVGGLTERWNNRVACGATVITERNSPRTPLGLVRAATHDDSPHAGTGRRSGDRRTAAATGAERRRKADLVSLPAVPVADILRRPTRRQPDVIWVLTRELTAAESTDDDLPTNPNLAISRDIIGL